MEKSFVTMQDIDKIIKIDSDTKKVQLDNSIIIYFIESLIEKSALTENIKMPYFNRNINFNAYLSSISDEITLDQVETSIAEGNVIALYNGKIKSTNVCTRKDYRQVQENVRESVYEGSLEELVEDITTNMSVIRRYYPNSNLTVKEFQVGQKISTSGVLLYDEKLVDNNMLSYVEKAIEKVQAPVIQTYRELEHHILDHQWIVPRILITFRPDRIARYLAKGKIIILLNATNGAAVLPVTFHQFMVAADDYYLFPIAAIFFMMLRYLGLFLTLTLPAAYVAISSYNPEIFRIQLALSITETRSGVTYPSYIEVIFMLIMLEFLIEASIRLPKTIGQAATTVGGLILSQSAAEAQLVSDIMIIIAAAVALTNFVIPTSCLSIPVRIGKYIVLLFGSLAGVYGVFIGLLSITVYGFSVYNFSLSYINPVGALTIKNLKEFFRRDKL